jgi:hypothetical protein
MDNALNTHRRKMEKEIKIMRTNNSKDYWKLLKSKNKREEPDIPITSFYDFFKNLNAAPAGLIIFNFFTHFSISSWVILLLICSLRQLASLGFICGKLKNYRTLYLTLHFNPALSQTAD